MGKKVCLIVLITMPIFIAACASTSVEGEPVTAFDILEKTEATEWDMVVLGDSDMDPAYMFYSDYYEEDLGVNIVTHVKTRPTTFTDFAHRLEDPQIRSLISEAEIIIFNIPIVLPSTGGACFDTRKNMETDGCFDVSMDEYVETTRQFIREIKNIVREKGAMIRLQNGYVPTMIFQGGTNGEDISQDCLECFAAFWAAQAEVASEENIPLVDVFTFFHGEDHQLDPYKNGYIGSDHMHVNYQGAQVIADLYRQVGYEYWKP